MESLNRHSMASVALAASLVVSCGSPEEQPPSPAGTGGASEDGVPAGASDTTPPGPLVPGGNGMAVTGTGETTGTIGGVATDEAGAASGGAGLEGVAVNAAAGAAGAGSAAPVSRPPEFVKTRLDPEFYSEGINYGDLDRDGSLDIIAGPYWFPGPGYADKRTFREPRATPFDVSGDSDCYSIFVHDLNGDGWLDVLSFRLPGGAEAVWYENPDGGDGYWPEHVVFSAVDNESATFTDIDGDGMPELVTQSGGFGGWAQPDWNDPAQPWEFRNVTARGNWPRYTHGMGVGDVNQDGRADLLFAEGWWEQPESASAAPWLSHAASFWGQEASGESYGGAQMFADDVDGDGDNDVVTSLQAHGWGLAWFEQTDEGFVRHLVMNTRDEEALYGAAFAQLHALDLADVDGDGLKDIVTGKRKGAHGNGLGAELDAPAVLYWFRLVREPGQPPRYEPHLLDSETGVGTQVVVGDVNGDGLPDILTAARAGAFLFLNR